MIKKIDHIGIAVSSLNESIPVFEKLLDTKLEKGILIKGKLLTLKK